MRMPAAIPLLAALCAGATAFGATAEIKPGDNLVVDGIPPIAATLAEEVGRYTESRPATFEGWHPVRREVLIGTRFADTAQVHRVKSRVAPVRSSPSSPTA